MSTVDEIKAATAGLPLEKKIELQRWLEESEDIRRWRLEDLQRELQKGLDSLARGDVAPLDIEAIKREGRKRLAAQQQAKNA